MIKNLNKRIELANVIYESYTAKIFELTSEQKRDHENEVGAIFKGYEMALSEIGNLIDENKTIQEIKQFIKTQLSK